MTDTITIRRPDDWHVHLPRWRCDARCRALHRATVCAGDCDAQPVAAGDERRGLRSLSRPHTGGSARGHRLHAADDRLSDRFNTEGEELARGFAEGVFTAAKLYPAHATTGSAHGVTDIASIMPALERMAQTIGMPLLIHGEVTDHDVDIFDREAVFIERTLVRPRPRPARTQNRLRTYHHRRCCSLC